MGAPASSPVVYLKKIVPKARVPNVGAARETPKCRDKASRVYSAFFLIYAGEDARAPRDAGAPMAYRRRRGRISDEIS